MHKLRDVDAVCKIPAPSRDKCEIHHRLLPRLRGENDGDANVWRLQIWAGRMERRWHLLCLQGTGVDSGKTTQKSWRGALTMDVREKLVELLDIIIQPGQRTLGDIADYLISNGVTVQE